jgi:uncharacterized DUF497 family protein
VGYDFEWDANKEAANQRKHGVTFKEATTVFGDPRAVNMSDPMHSLEEERFTLLGLSRLGRVLVVCYTDRSPRTRIITARVATKRERRMYESP